MLSAADIALYLQLFKGLDVADILEPSLISSHVIGYYAGIIEPYPQKNFDCAQALINLC
ncbi:hypothetical protein BDD43_4690 [Mucilaginibacter gracilis]|uniref:Uncharacterized protein n=1 Tax=Mucilaginibacter gracilis TaxID=423350 RepID=A0A495J6T4_9SPHI|nr:hypothetical protein [Mucilaginibacter gracilis]RKR84453.1 hypothetical protein BDD43_4690 [Mucilaginibacter gracilis]